MKKVFTILCSLILFANTAALAAPTISNQTPTSINHGNNFILTGSNFGSKTQAAPVIWDNFESGVNDNYLSDHSSWSGLNGGAGAKYSNANSHSGSLSAHNNVYVGSGTEFATNYQEFAATDEVYVSYMFRHEITGNPYGVMKLSRITSNQAFVLHYNGPGELKMQYQPHAGWGYTNYNPGTMAVQKTTGGLIEGTWQRIEMYSKLSTPGENDGIISIAIDNEIKWYDDAVMTRGPGENFQLNAFLLGLMLANPREDGNFNIYVDDIYVDNSFARVEIGNAATYGDCTQREIQNLTAWDDTSISLDANLGSFTANDNLYMFVVDDLGNVSPGYALNPVPEPATITLLLFGGLGLAGFAKKS